jgi:hypothetical protein
MAKFTEKAHTIGRVTLQRSVETRLSLGKAVDVVRCFSHLARPKKSLRYVAREAHIHAGVLHLNKAG